MTPVCSPWLSIHVYMQEFSCLEEALDAYVIVCWLATKAATNYAAFKRILQAQPSLLCPAGFNSLHHQMALTQRFAIIEMVDVDYKWTPTAVKRTVSKHSATFVTLFDVFGVSGTLLLRSAHGGYDRLIYCLRIWLTFLSSSRYRAVHR